MQKSAFDLVNSKWTAKENFPTLAGRAKMISIDVETCDPFLKEKGPGALRKDGFICGFSVATEDGFSGYYPIKHKGGGNLPNPDNAIAWLRDQVYDNTPKVGANLLYDALWLQCDLGVRLGGKLYDIQVAEPLLDENRLTYSLDSLAESYLGKGKVEDTLYEVGNLCYGFVPLKSDEDYKAKDPTHLEYLKKKDIIAQVKTKLWELPAHLVGEYGEADAVLPIKIFEKQKKRLEEDDLWNLFNDLETELLRLLLDMWIRGIPVDVDKAERTADELQIRRDACVRKIQCRLGESIDIWSNKDCAKACEKLGLNYPLTDKENPSFVSEWLDDQEHDFFKLLLEARQLDRSGSVFIRDKILSMEINGRIHPQFWQVKTDRYGTGSGRLSSSNPNAQQFPSRNPELTRLVRGCLVAEPGCKWGVFDYSQQEPRVQVHYACLLGLPGSKKAQEQYINDPLTDYHQWVADMTGLPRKTAKSVNLGMAYGMGARKFSEKYGFTLSEAYEVYKQYHAGLPFVKKLSEECERAAKRRGYVKTLLGRRRHFDLWGPPQWKKGIAPLPYEEAKKKFGNVIRYFTYRSGNSVIQGGSADMNKKAMIDCYRAGYLPYLTVHDELDFCDIVSKKQIKEITESMLNAIKLLVPMKVDVELGPDWGNCKEEEI